MISIFDSVFKLIMEELILLVPTILIHISRQRILLYYRYAYTSFFIRINQQKHHYNPTTRHLSSPIDRPSATAYKSLKVMSFSLGFPTSCPSRSSRSLMRQYLPHVTTHPGCSPRLRRRKSWRLAVSWEV